MHRSLRCAVPFLLASALTAPILAGCAVHARVYDPYTRAYYPWVNERGYYTQWEDETHREHRNFTGRDEEEQREYWRWRDRRYRHGDDPDYDRP